MATRTKNGEQPTLDALNELRRDFEQRIHEIQENLEEGTKGDAEQSLFSLRKDFERRLSYVRKQVDESLDPGRDVIRERPLAAIGAAVASALAAGVVFGVLLTRTATE